VATANHTSLVCSEFSELRTKDSPMTKINIAAADLSEPANPNEPQQNPQQNQQPGNDDRHQQGGLPEKDKPAQQK
jgi:hypothetical protein